jgi:phospholipid transport system transporter-binding protein
VSELDPPVSVTSPGCVTVHSALTFATARRVCEAGVACFIRDGSATIIVDCSAVAHADSAGLAVLIEWRRWAHQHGRQVKFTNLPAQISAIAHLSEVSAVLADATV